MARRSAETDNCRRARSRAAVQAGAGNRRALARCNAASARARPSAVFGPVLFPPCILHRPPLPFPGAWQGLPLRVFAPHRGFIFGALPFSLSMSRARTFFMGRRKERPLCPCLPPSPSDSEAGRFENLAIRAAISTSRPLLILARASQSGSSSLRLVLAVTFGSPVTVIVRLRLLAVFIGFVPMPPS